MKLYKKVEFNERSELVQFIAMPIWAWLEYKNGNMDEPPMCAFVEVKTNNPFERID